MRGLIPVLTYIALSLACTYAVGGAMGALACVFCCGCYLCGVVYGNTGRAGR